MPNAKFEIETREPGNNIPTALRAEAAGGGEGIVEAGNGGEGGDQIGEQAVDFGKGRAAVGGG